MLTVTRFIAVIRDREKGPIRYFGPFVSESLTNGYVDTLIVGEGGFKLVRPIETTRH